MRMEKHERFGFDFGTTNSAIGRADAKGEVELLSFPSGEGWSESLRSLLYLEKHREGHRSIIASFSGFDGIAKYLEADEKGRLMQSLKSFLSSGTLQTTEVFGKRFTLESLIAKLLRDIRLRAEAKWGAAVRNLTVGRPVRFVGSENEGDDAFALDRLRKALGEAGFERVSFEYEPIAAAAYYESTLDHDEVILIGDFGGGTSDFSLLPVGPSFRNLTSGERKVIGNAGLGLAGDAFDARLIRHLVSPRLGAGTFLKSGGKDLPVPNWVYFKLERWHHLSFLRSKETLHMLESVARQAMEPDKIESLLYLVKHDLGFALHTAVQKVKAALSMEEQTRFQFNDGDVDVDLPVTRKQFEDWIEPELMEVEKTLDALLSESGTDPKEVNRVFLTGGTSFVPAIRRLFANRFGKSKISTGREFTSVAYGLALASAHS